jgi:Na+-transporting methylmalonyl-CoA/oxaloacetate decarboxylase gamma subunit
MPETRKELAALYCEKMGNLIAECWEDEKEARKQKQDLKKVYYHNDTRFARVLNNYEARLKELPVV